MRFRVFFALLAFISTTAVAFDDSIKAANCSSPEACIDRLYEVIDRDSVPGAYPSRQEQEVLQRLLEFEHDGFISLVALLSNEDELVARAAAVALREAESIDAIYLSEIIDGLENDVSWLAPALGRIGGSDAAYAAVRFYLNNASSPHNQEAYAIRLLGQDAFPAIIDATKCLFGCDDRTFYLLGYVLREMDLDLSTVALDLAEIVEDQDASLEIRQGALRVIAYLGDSGLVIEDRLFSTRDENPAFAEAVDDALIGIKSGHAGDIFAERLYNGSDRLILRDIAEFGPRASSAGAEVIKLLDGSDTEERLLAARTLGFIEYQDGVEQLIELLNDQVDVRLAWVAAQSLGRIGSVVAKPALERIAQRHWYPPVRAEAELALARIQSGEPYESAYHERNFPFEFFSYQHLRITSCDHVPFAKMREPASKKLYKADHPYEIEELTYPSIVFSYDAGELNEDREGGPDEIVDVDSEVFQEQSIVRVPDVALRVAEGWLVGSNRGEWGGELVNVTDDGQFHAIMHANIENLYRFGDQYVTVSGLAHMTMNSGVIHLVEQDGDGNWHSRIWRILPGAPYSSGLLETGELLVNTVSGGSILVSADGLMRMAPCARVDHGSSDLRDTRGATEVRPGQAGSEPGS